MAHSCLFSSKFSSLISINTVDSEAACKTADPDQLALLKGIKEYNYPGSAGQGLKGWWRQIFWHIRSILQKIRFDISCESAAGSWFTWNINLSYICLFWLFTSQSIIFQSCRDAVLPGWTGTEQRIKCLAQGHNAVPPVKLELATPRSQVKYSHAPLSYTFFGGF